MSSLGTRATGDGLLQPDLRRSSERSLCPQAIGRRKYLFVGSDRGVRTAATLYNLVAGGKRDEIDPYAYRKDVLERLPAHVRGRSASSRPTLGWRRILGRDDEPPRKT
jgi:hypothetical protein